jgi:hypothetical protein
MMDWLTADGSTDLHPCAAAEINAIVEFVNEYQEEINA